MLSAAPTARDRIDNDSIGTIRVAPCKVKEIRSVTTLLCSFNGKTLAVKRWGEVAGQSRTRPARPSLTFLDGVYYLTIRANANKDHVSTSRDRLTWTDPVPWA